MNKITKQINIRNILLLGLVLRLIFMFWGASIYYGMNDYTYKWGDTHAWITCLKNLVHNGTFTADLNYENGKFFRPPGYSFFMMPFYFISWFDEKKMLLLVQLTQVLLDTISIWFVYKIVENINGNNATKTISSLLYCIYPFSIVWSPTLVAESPSVFFLLLSFYFITREPSSKNYLISGLALGFAVLLRVQIIFAAPAIAIFLISKNKSLKKLFIAPAIFFFLAFGITYGSWPLRNLCYGKFIPAEELQNDKHFSADFIAYMFYIWSVKTDHNPQFEQIINGQPVEWPKASYLHPQDSITLARMAVLCNTCGRGFSHFKASAGKIDKPILEENDCTKEIAATFNRLRIEQIKENPIHFYILVPLSNLKKALFKITLYGEKSNLVKTVSIILFSYRTLFIMLGLCGIWINKKTKSVDQGFLNVILIYFLLWYLVISFGYRNMEIRYFLMNDVMLLIPASISILFIAEKIQEKFFVKE